MGKRAKQKMICVHPTRLDGLYPHFLRRRLVENLTVHFPVAIFKKIIQDEKCLQALQHALKDKDVVALSYALRAGLPSPLFGLQLHGVHVLANI